MKKNKNKSPFILRFLTALTVLFLIVSITCTIMVNWLELESRKTDTAPTLFGWSFVSLNEDFADEALYAGDLLFARSVEEWEEGMMVLCRDLESDSLPADNRFALARITFIREGEFGLNVLTNGERIGLIADSDALLGEAQYSIRWLGEVSTFMRTPVGFFSLILGPGALLLLLILLRAILAFRRHRRMLAEENAESADEDAAIPVSEEEEPSLLNQAVLLSEETEPLEGDVGSKSAPEEEPLKAEDPVKEEAPEAADIKMQVKAQVEIATEIEPVMKEPEPIIEAAPEVKTEPAAARAADQWILSVISAEPEEKPKEEKKTPSFRDMDADDILEQFRLELEEARLKALSEEKE